MQQENYNIVTLRDLIKQKHDRAENHAFVKTLFAGKLPTKVYAEFLYNQLFIYRALEVTATNAGALNDIENIKRVEKIEKDLEFFNYTDLKIHPSTYQYISYVKEITDVDKLIAHIYVRHMGDMFGGSMIKKVTSGPGNMYEFENKSELIQKLRLKLSLDMADEANIVFDFAIKLFEDLANEYDIQ